MIRKSEACPLSIEIAIYIIFALKWFIKEVNSDGNSKR